MRRFLYITFLTLIILAGVALGAAFMMPKDAIIDNIKKEVLASTGRNIEISNVNLMFWPNIGVELRDVKLSNHEQSQFDNIFSVSKLQFAVAVMPLFHRQVKFQKIELVGPQINIELLNNGETSFTFKKADQSPKTEAVGETVKEENNLIDNFKFEFGNIEISKANVDFVNKGEKHKLEDVTLTIKYPRIDGVFNMEGSVKYNGALIGAFLSLDNLLDIIEGKSSKGIVRLMYGRSKAEVTGTLAQKIDNLDADVEIDIRSVSNFLKLINKEDLTKKVGFSRVKLLGELSAEEDNVTIAKADLELDDLKAIGDLDIDLGAHPNIFARLTSNKIDLDKLINKFKKPKSEKVAKVAAKSDDGKIDLSALKKFDADVILQTDGLVFDGVDVGRVALTTLLKDGDLNLSIENATIYNGEVSSKIRVNSGYGTPSMSVDLDAKDVDAKQFLNKFADFDKVSGKLDAVMFLQSVGDNKEQLIDNSKGKGTIKFRDGEFRDIDLLEIAKLTQKRVKNLEVGKGSTKFETLGGTFTVARGLVTNNDLRMRSEALNLKARGNVNLPMKKVKYYVTPTLLNRDGKKEGISIPLKIAGRFIDIKVTPDFKAVADELLKDPITVEEKARSIKKELKETVKTVKENLKEDIKEDPVKALQGFFGSIMNMAPPSNSNEQGEIKPSEEF